LKNALAYYHVAVVSAKVVGLAPSQSSSLLGMSELEKKTIEEAVSENHFPILITLLGCFH
jgi:hypothetical protein